MRLISAFAAVAAVSLVAACDNSAKPPSQADIQAQANAPATNYPTPGATPPAPPAPPAPVAAPVVASPSATPAAAAAKPGATPATTAPAKPGAAPAATVKPAAVPAAPAVPAFDLANGQAKFAICKICHSVTQGAPSGLGPNLFGVTTRKPGSLPGYPYSDAFAANAPASWTDAKLDQWITDPRAMIPNTKMVFAGIKDPKDRADIIGYLKTVK